MCCVLREQSSKWKYQIQDPHQLILFGGWPIRCRPSGSAPVSTGIFDARSLSKRKASTALTSGRRIKTRNWAHSKERRFREQRVFSRIQSTGQGLQRGHNRRGQQPFLLIRGLRCSFCCSMFSTFYTQLTFSHWHFYALSCWAKGYLMTYSGLPPPLPSSNSNPPECSAQGLRIQSVPADL